MSEILRITNLTKSFQTKRNRKTEIVKAVDHISFSLQEDERMGIIGASGCGKTTLLKLILGILKPDEGEIQCSGMIGFVAQDPYSSLCPRYKVEKIVAEPLIYMREVHSEKACREKVEETLEMVHLSPEIYRERYPYQLSGGERQRVSLARALIRNPQILILDEPASMLDYEVKSSIAETIMNIAEKRKIALLMVTHDIEFARSLSSRLCVMNRGKFVEQGITEELCSHPKEEFTRMLFAASMDLEEFWRMKDANENV